MDERSDSDDDSDDDGDDEEEEEEDNAIGVVASTCGGVSELSTTSAAATPITAVRKSYSMQLGSSIVLESMSEQEDNPPCGFNAGAP